MLCTWRHCQPPSWPSTLELDSRQSAKLSLVSRGKRSIGHTNGGILNSWRFYNNGWQELPTWGSAFNKLGAQFSGRDQDRRLVVGLALPTRAYAATFTALGFMLEQAKVPLEQFNAEEHFANLCALPAGSAVKYQDTTDGKVKDALFIGCEVKWGQLCVGVRKNRTGKEDWLPQALAQRIQVSSKVITQLSKAQKGRSLTQGSEFLCACAEGLDIVDYRLYSRLECVFIGNKDALTQELTETSFAVASSGLCRGTLQDVVRARELLPEGDGYRAKLLSDRSKPLAPSEMPKLVLFDGAVSFLKWRDLWRDAHWLVVLDKTQNGFDEAVAALNREYRDNHCGDTPPNFPFLPEHLNVMAYEETK